MNFFSHYIYDRRSGSAAYNSGLILPDLLRNSGIRLKNYHWELEPEHPGRELSLGVAQHYNRDLHWHDSDFFKRSQAELRQMVLKRGIDPDHVRLFFLEHILVELLLDRQWVRKEPALLSEFYWELTYLQEPECLQTLKEQELEHLDKFQRFMNRFLEARYLFQYAFNEQFFYSLSRIYQRVGLQLDPSVQEPLTEAVLQLEEEWSKSVNLDSLEWT